MKLSDLIIGEEYINIKNKKMYHITGMGHDTETLQYNIRYEDENGKEWHRPIGLFLLKFLRKNNMIKYFVREDKEGRIIPLSFTLPHGDIVHASKNKIDFSLMKQFIGSYIIIHYITDIEVFQPRKEVGILKKVKHDKITWSDK